MFTIKVYNANLFDLNYELARNHGESKTSFHCQYKDRSSRSRPCSIREPLIPFRLSDLRAEKLFISPHPGENPSKLKGARELIFYQCLSSEETEEK